MTASALSADAAQRETRRWHLCGYAGKELVHDAAVTGDRNLNDAMRSLEGRAGVTRITAAPL